jgi:hypothetical protein
MRLLQLSIHNFQFSSLLRRSNFGYEGRINYQLSLINAATWKMANGKRMENGKWLMVNATPAGGARG